MRARAITPRARSLVCPCCATPLMLCHSACPACPASGPGGTLPPPLLWERQLAPKASIPNSFIYPNTFLPPHLLPLQARLSSPRERGGCTSWIPLLSSCPWQAPPTPSAHRVSKHPAAWTVCAGINACCRSCCVALPLRLRRTELPRHNCCLPHRLRTPHQCLCSSPCSPLAFIILVCSLHPGPAVRSVRLLQPRLLFYNQRSDLQLSIMER